MRILKKVEDIKFCTLTTADVVRHSVVQRIVKAYEDYEKRQENKTRQKT